MSNYTCNIPHIESNVQFPSKTSLKKGTFRNLSMFCCLCMYTHCMLRGQKHFPSTLNLSENVAGESGENEPKQLSCGPKQ